MGIEREIEINKLRLMSYQQDVMECELKIVELSETLKKIKTNEPIQNIEKYVEQSKTLINSIIEIELRISKKFSEDKLLNK